MIPVFARAVVINTLALAYALSCAFSGVGAAEPEAAVVDPAAVAFTSDAAIDAILKTADRGILSPEAGARLLPNGKSRAILLKPGKSAAPLRFSWTSGTRAEQIMRIDMDMKQDIKDMMKTDLAMPRMVIYLQPEITAAGGSATVAQQRMVMTKVEVEARADHADDPKHQQMVGAMQGAMGSMSGITMTSATSDHGVVSDTAVTIPEDAAPQVAQQFAGMKGQISGPGVTLPSEPLGLGGTWISLQPIEQNGMSLIQVGRCTLTARTATTIGVTMVLQQFCAKTKPEMAQLPPGAEMTINQYEISGNATLVVDLTSGIAVTSTATAGGTFAMDMTMAGKVMKIIGEIKAVAVVGPADKP